MDPGSKHVTVDEGGGNGDAAASRPLRADAARNRERILEAAEATFTAEGVSAPIDAVAQRMMFYKIESVRQDFVNQCEVLVKASRLMTDAVGALRRMKELRHPKNGKMSLDQLIIAVHEAEEEGDAIHHHFLAELFECGLDAFQVIKWKELYQLVEEAIDYCDDVACVVHRMH